jgi:hypothetical protein
MYRDRESRSRSAMVASVIKTVCVILINLVIPLVIVLGIAPVDIVSFNTHMFFARKRSLVKYRTNIFGFANLFIDDSKRTLVSLSFLHIYEFNISIDDSIQNENK